MSLILIVIFFLLTNAFFTSALINLPQYFVNLLDTGINFFIIATLAVLVSWLMGDN